jgi:hypothetical protein
LKFRENRFIRPLVARWLFQKSKRSIQVTFKQGETDMGDSGKRDKSKREQQKKAKLSPKEKRRLKKEKKNK